MLNLFGFESPLALDGVDGELGEFGADTSSCWATAAREVEVSIMDGGAFRNRSVEGGGVCFSESCASFAGDRGAPHCDMKERTTQKSVYSWARESVKRGMWMVAVGGMVFSALSVSPTYHDYEA